MANNYAYMSTGAAYTLCSYGKAGTAGGTNFDADVAHVNGAMYAAGSTLGNCGT